MKNILISGLVNTETTLRVRQFPLDYYPIDYPFFGVNTAVSGVAYNIALALTTLGDKVQLHSMVGEDFQGKYIRHVLEEKRIGTEHLHGKLEQTPSSVVLYDGTGRRQIHCDLKNIQEARLDFAPEDLTDIDLVVACNINFNRPLLHLAKRMGKTVATDVHVLSNVWDDYNREFLEQADIVFLSDEGIQGREYDFLMELQRTYGMRLLVLGRGSRGAAMYVREENRYYEFPAQQVGPVVNTVGAGDALFSAFVHYYGKGLHPVEALNRAKIFASAKIGVSGASKGFVSEETVEELWERSR